MMAIKIRTCCPKCSSKKFKLNGHIHNGKQTNLCKACHRSFVTILEKKYISKEELILIKNLLTEKISMCGICRVLGISFKTVSKKFIKTYKSVPNDLGQLQFDGPRLKTKNSKIILTRHRVECDELFSFVGKKSNQVYLWLALNPDAKQVVAFHVGERDSASAKNLWIKIPQNYKDHSLFFTDKLSCYNILPRKIHISVKGGNRVTNHVEIFFLTMRQRVSRLVRKTLSFSKKLVHHIGAIKIFLHHYNLVNSIP